MKRLYFWNIGVFTLFAASTAALAHGPGTSNIPVLNCWQEGSEIACKSSWSLGRPMGKATLEVIVGGKLLSTLKSDAKGEARFTKPAGEFVVLMYDVRGNGQTVEVHAADVAASAPKPAKAS